jgi:putative ABC transport system substrate-binding protein
MKRREFIMALGGMAVLWPRAGRAQKSAPPKRVGVLNGGVESEFQIRYQLFRDELTRLGWSEPATIRIDYRSSNNNRDLMRAYAKELVGFAPDVLLANPGPAAEALQEVTRTIPIVFVTSTDPVAAGYVQSFAHPGTNMTGFAQFEASVNSKWLQLLKDVAPNLTKAVVLRVGGIARARRDFVTVQEIAKSLAVEPIDALINDDPTPADILRVVDAFASEPNVGLIVPPSGSLLKYRALIAGLADQHRLPAVYFSRLFVDAGGLMSYGVDQLANFREAASYVDRILRGSNPADLPVQAASRYELVVNLKTAKALGLTISREFLLAADEVIE